MTSASRALPPIQEELRSIGIKERKLGKNKNKVLYTVDDLPQRAGSVPLLNHSRALPSVLSHNNSNNATSIVSRSTMIDDYLTSSNHASVKGVSRWKQVLEGEKTQFSSLSMWGELMLSKVQRETAHLPTPNPLKTAVCCMILNKVAPLMGNSESLLKSLLMEIFNAVYYSWNTYLEDKFADGGSHSDPKHVPVENVYDERSLSEDPAGATSLLDVKFLVSSLSHRYTYFQLLQELQESRTRVLGLPSRIINRCLDVWRMRVLRVSFIAWKGDTDRNIAVRKKITLTANKWFERKNNASVLAHLRAWKVYVTERRHRNLQDHEQTQRKLQQRMGRRIKELELENEDLKRQLRELQGTHTSAVTQLSHMVHLLEKFRCAARGEFDQIDDVLSSDHSSAKVTPQSIPMEMDTPSESNQTFENIRDTLSMMSQGANEEMRRQNLAVLFPDLVPKRRSSEATTAPALDDLHKLQVDAEEAASVPNRVNQLSHYLLQIEQNSLLSPKAEPTSHNKQESTLFEKSARSELHVIDPSVAVNYADVLDWVSVRTQLRALAVANGDHGLRRCTNFTIDFRDSIRLVCLLLSLGADRSVLDDAAAIVSPVERAEFALKMARCFFVPTDHGYDDVCSVTALDLSKGKGSKVSNLMYTFYRKFNSVPLQIPPYPVEEAIAVNLRAAGAIVQPWNPPPPPQSPPKGDRTPITSPNNQSPLPVEFDDHRIPDTQFAAWFRELAASDSDDDATNFFDAALGGSVIGAVSERLHRRASRLSFRMTPTHEGSLRKSKKSKHQELSEAMIRWVKQKISLQYDGKEVPSFSSMSSLDVLQCVLQSLFPKINFTASDDKTRVKRLQACLSNKLGLKKVQLSDSYRPATESKVSDELAIPLKELLMLIFLSDQQLLVNI